MNFVENICALTSYGANASDAGSSPVLMLTSRAIGSRNYELVVFRCFVIRKTEGCQVHTCVCLEKMVFKH